MRRRKLPQSRGLAVTPKVQERIIRGPKLTAIVRVPCILKQSTKRVLHPREARFVMDSQVGAQRHDQVERDRALAVIHICFSSSVGCSTTMADGAAESIRSSGSAK